MRGTLRDDVPEVRAARPSHRRRSGATPAIGEGQARAGEAEHAQGGHQDGYQYDLQGRLTEVRQDGDLTESYTYDDNRNRLSADTLEGSVTATYDDQDRLLTYGDFVYSYTANGELLTKTDTSSGEVTAYEYDVFGNLVRVDLPNGDIIEYLVDGQNRRVGKRFNGVLTKQWLWADQLRIAAELDGAGNLLSRFVYGDKQTTPELVIRGSAVYRVISDHVGSVRALVNIDNPSDVPVRVDYEAFGGVSGTGVGVVPQGFAGGLYDAETGLVRFGARDYEPGVGRWVSKDPIRFDGGVNLFLYASGDPVNFADATGENTIALGAAAAAAVAVGFAYLYYLYLDANQEALEDLCKPFAVSRPWKCDASCNVDAIGERYTGYGTGSTQDAACKAAKKDANSRIPRGTYKRHCQCSCSR